MSVEKTGPMIVDPNELTPWENRNGILYKREDYFRNQNGVNGAKYRACRHLIETAVADTGADHIVSAQSVRSPQAAITATIAADLGLDCTIVVGASKPETAVKHPSVRIAVEAGAHLDTTPKVAYNPVIQPYARRLAEDLGGYQVPYAISPPADASPEALRAFFSVGGNQVRNLPEEVETLVIAFGSGNTTAGMLYGLHQHGHKNVRDVILVGVGPDRSDWLWDRLEQVKAVPKVNVEVQSLHGWFASYSDSMPESRDGINFHPTYEGKVIRYLDSAKPEWWTEREGRTGFWIVGGEM